MSAACTFQWRVGRQHVIDIYQRFSKAKTNRPETWTIYIYFSYPLTLSFLNEQKLTRPYCQQPSAAATHFDFVREKKNCNSLSLWRKTKRSRYRDPARNSRPFPVRHHSYLRDRMVDDKCSTLSRHLPSPSAIDNNFCYTTRSGVKRFRVVTVPFRPGPVSHSRDAQKRTRPDDDDDSGCRLSSHAAHAKLASISTAQRFGSAADAAATTTSGIWVVCARLTTGARRVNRLI